MINKRFGILKLLGEGRSKVFLCEDKFFPSQKFAMKILPVRAGEDEEQSFVREYRLLKKLSHPNIVKVFEAGTILNQSDEEKFFGIEKGSRFFILEYTEGKNLREVDFVRSPELLTGVIAQLSSFLCYLHFANYIYFDLKLENIICVEGENGIALKIIDFGLTQKSDVPIAAIRRGTASYIAPELLLNEKADSRADLYSLGILLYHLVYGKFPFTAENELEIYRVQVKEEFSFPKSEVFSADVLNVIELLLKKNPSERIQSALQLFFLLHLPIENYYLNLISATHFIENKNDSAFIDDYIENKERNEILVLQGTQNSGKSSIAQKLANSHQNALLVERLPRQHPELILQYILGEIIFNPFVYKSISEKIDELLKKVEASDSNNEGMPALFSEISAAQNFILILDDYHLIDEAVKEALLKIIPVVQLHGCKIILLTDQTMDDSTAAMHNKIERRLSPLALKEIPLFLKENFAKNFPQKKILPLIKKYADLFPGSILLFLNELITGKIISFSMEGIFVDEEKARKFSGVSQNTQFKKSIAGISESEKEVLRALSSFKVEITTQEAKMVLHQFSREIEKDLLALQKKNLLRMNAANNFIQFASTGLKNYVYSGITGKTLHHKKIARSSNAANLPPKELSRHFELAEEYDEAYLCLKPEIERAYALSAFMYVTKIFTHLLELPLNQNFAVEVRREYLNVLRKTGDNEVALKIIRELETLYGAQSATEVLIKKGIFLIASGEVVSGKKILLDEAEKLPVGFQKTELLLEIANANLITNQYHEAQTLLATLQATENLTHEQKGKVYNAFGLLELYKNNDTEKAFASFTLALKAFTEANLKQRIARVHVNLGNICSMKGNYRQAEVYWKSSLFINNAIGDLEQEALLLMNFGIFLFDTAKYEQAVESYKNAKHIFQAIGKKNGYALSLINSAETHLMICEYSLTIKELQEAVTIFQSTENKEEEAGAHYLLAKTFAIAGDKQLAETYGGNYAELITQEELSDKHHLQLKLLTALMSYYFDDEFPQLDNDGLLSLCLELLDTDNKYDALLAALIYVDHCLHHKKFKPVHTFLMNEKFQELCSVNKVYSAVRLFLLGETSKLFRFGDRVYIDYLTEAYETIKQESITEFTRLILASLGKVYFERNLFSKAKEFFNLTEGLIIFLSNTISDTSVRNAYLAKKERNENLQFIRNSLSHIP